MVAHGSTSVSLFKSLVKSFVKTLALLQPVSVTTTCSQLVAARGGVVTRTVFVRVFLCSIGSPTSLALGPDLPWTLE